MGAQLKLKMGRRVGRGKSKYRQHGIFIYTCVELLVTDDFRGKQRAS